jgi:hypothetical protein
MTMTVPAAFSDMVFKIRIFVRPVDDLFASPLSTILHAAMKM